jgi:hypothetical protein
VYRVQVLHDTCRPPGVGGNREVGEGCVCGAYGGGVRVYVAGMMPETCRDIYDNKSQFFHQVGTSHHLK